MIVRCKTDLDVCESWIEGTREELSYFLTTNLHRCPLPSHTQGSRAQVSTHPILFCVHLNRTFALPLCMDALCPKMAHLGFLIPEGSGFLGVMECVCLCCVGGAFCKKMGAVGRHEQMQEHYMEEHFRTRKSQPLWCKLRM